MQSLLVLGRQPNLGLAELASLYGRGRVELIRPHVALVDIDPCLLAFDRLGGSLKFGKVLSQQPTTNLSDVMAYLIKVAPSHAQTVPEGKLHLGLSIHGYDLPLKEIHRLGLSLKRAIAQSGRSVRLVPNKAAELSSAQVIHNKLTTPNGWELLLIKAGRQTIIAQTVKVQDIASYSKRDYGRPSRHPRVGMLPPKLAQIIINLASGPLGETQLSSICDIPAGESTRPILDQTVVDPFCGTGVIAQEALLMGYKVIASDIDPKMVAAAQQNLDWLSHNYSLDRSRYELKAADATSYSWPEQIELVASELDLGPPLSELPQAASLEQIVSRADQLVRSFLLNIKAQLVPSARICLALPAWRLDDQRFRFLPLIDQIDRLGYNQIKFKEAGDLIYFRPNQIVARQLIVLERGTDGSR